MDAPRWRKIESLFHAALQRPESQRAAFLEAACGNDPELRRELDLLLAQPQSGEGFLDGGVLRDASSSHLTALAAEPGSLAIGAQLGIYRITGRLGAGGMGEVYRAFDTRLKRDVAIKIVPRGFGPDVDRPPRFEREARLLATLNHPNIGAIYGIEEAPGEDGRPQQALILELIEGPTLADHIAHGPIAPAEAIDIAIQIADALEAAHEKGIVHRDLKPANVKLTAGTLVKVLDFGLATHQPQPNESDAPAPTGEQRTAAGTILGTAPYMSPEQARGQPVDKRTDVWAFGCVLFEMLAGRRAFQGDTVSDTLARILERDVDFDLLPAATPARVRRVIARTLVKDPRRRLRDIGDARLDLADAGLEAAVPPDDFRLRPSWRTALLWSALAAGLLVSAAIGRESAAAKPTPKQPFLQLALNPGTGEPFARDVAVSPDGAWVAFNAGPPGDYQTYLRSLADGSTRVVTTLPTDFSQPFFSPDSKWLAFFDDGKLKKVSVRGGSPVALAPAPAPRGGAWGRDGSIVYCPAARAGLLWLPPAGGTPQTLTTPDPVEGETSHREPVFLPDGRTVVFLSEGAMSADRALMAVTVPGGRPRLVLQTRGHHPKYVEPGYLVYLEDETLTAVRFDPIRGQVTSAAVPIRGAVGSYGLSSEGLLIYNRPSTASTAAVRQSRLVWVARDGTTQPLPLELASYDYPRLSPDGDRVVVNLQRSDDRSLWIFDLRRETMSRLTFGAANNFPVWTPDGKRLIYGINRPGTQWDIFAKAADGSQQEEPILIKPLTQLPRVVSPDSGTLVYTETDPAAGDTLWAVSLGGGSPPRPLLDRRHGEMHPTFSPDGRWLAYVSPETGRREVFVRAVAGAGGKWQVSTDGGIEPVWGRPGTELFYRSGDTMMSVAIGSGSTFSFERPRRLFAGSFLFGTTEGQEYDVTPDGKRFLMMQPTTSNRTVTPLEVVLNWREELEQRFASTR